MTKPEFKKANLDDDEESIIDPEMVERWLDSREGRLGDYRYNGRKYLLNSPWKPDTKRHLAILPGRFKFGRYRDWKSGKHGSVVDFVMEIDGISFGQALALVVPPSGRSRPRRERTPKQSTSLSKVSWDIQLPDGCVPLGREHVDGVGALRKAARYLVDRHIDPKRTEVYYCPKGRRMPDGRWQDLSNRVVFPYRDENGQLYYWTARALTTWQEPRYLEPCEADGGAPKEKVLYVPDWNISDRLVLVIEGPIDAISLNAARIPAVAVQGSSFYKEQMDLLRAMGVTPVWSFDPDLPGMKATVAAYEMWRGESYFVFAPDGMDWNKMLCHGGGPEAVKQHIVNNVRPLEERAIFELRSQISCLDKREKTAPSSLKRRR